MNKKYLFCVVSALVLNTVSYTYPHFSFNWFGRPVVEVDSLSSATSTVSRMAKKIAVTAALWSAYAVKQWWSVRSLVNASKKCFSYGIDYYNNKKNPFWVIRNGQRQLFGVDTIRTAGINKIKNFTEPNCGDIKRAIDRVDSFMKQLEKYTWMDKKIRQVATNKNINLGNMLVQGQIDILDREIQQWLATPESITNGFNWQWNGLENSLGRYVSNTARLSCRITRFLYQPRNKAAAQTYWELWNIKERLVALQERNDQSAGNRWS